MVIFYTLSPKETPRGLFAPGETLLDSPEEKRPRHGMKIQGETGMLFAPFPVIDQESAQNSVVGLGQRRL